MSEPTTRCTCNPPMAMSSGRCGYCGYRMPEDDNPMRRAADLVGDIVARVETLTAGDVHEMPAMMTNMDPDEFKAWLQSPGDLYLVYLPAGKAFPVKVPPEQYQFFVALLTQLRIHLGPEVQAMSAQPVDAPPSPQQTPPSPAVPPPNTGAVLALGPRAPRRCPGSGQMCRHPRNREIASNGAIRDAGRGPCPACGVEYKLTYAGTVRQHHDTR